MKPKFQPADAAQPNSDREAFLIDPEAYDASEQQFAASVEHSSSGAQPQLEDQAENESGLDAEATATPMGASAPPMTDEPSAIIAPGEASIEAEPAGSEEIAPTYASTDSELPSPDFWRQELAARLNRYRARRRPREPRYPSLQLKFENTEPVRSAPITPPIIRNHEIPSTASPATDTWEVPEIFPVQPRLTRGENPARIIAFPRSSLMPPGPLEELADPVMMRPRILEVPETVAPMPALGGILIEPDEEPAPEKRPGFEIPLQPAPLYRRLVAAGADAALVLLAAAALAGIFYKITASLPPLRPLLLAAGAVSLAFWAMYQYLFLVYSGTTPGLQLARLRLSPFDGSPAPRRLRRWRMLASLLSAASLGLGYAWCVLDEDGLCWHDRITRTYLAPLPTDGPDQPAKN